MKLDPDKLRDEVDGRDDRMKGALWAKDGGQPEHDWRSARCICANEPNADV